MVYLDFGAALCCWARLDAYWREGWGQLLVKGLELDGGLEVPPHLVINVHTGAVEAQSVIWRMCLQPRCIGSKVPAKI